MFKFCFAIFLLIASCNNSLMLKSQVPKKFEKKFSAEELQADFKELKKELENYHAGLYRYTSRDSLDKVFKAVFAQLDKEKSLLEFYQLLCPLITAIKCGHTRLRLPESQAKLIYQKQFPFSVKIIGEELFISKNLSDDTTLRAGTQILAINQKPIKKIIQDLLPYIPSDGNIETAKYRRIEKKFSYLYHIFFSDQALIYQIDLKDISGKNFSRSITLFNKNKPFEIPKIKEDNMNLLNMDVLESLSTAVLTIQSFDKGFLEREGFNFEKFLESSFLKLQSAKIANLIIDIRGNGGGDDVFGSLLVSYLSPNPFRYFQSIEVTKAYSGFGGVQKSQEGKYYLTNLPSLSLQKPAKNYFKGNVFILIDGLTFSTAADFLAVSHYLKLAKFIGEESGGAYYGNTSGITPSFTLSNTGLILSVPRWKYSNAVAGFPFIFRGTMPDYLVESTAKDLAEDIDAVKKFTFQLIEQQKTNISSKQVKKSNQ